MTTFKTRPRRSRACDETRYRRDPCHSSHNKLHLTEHFFRGFLQQVAAPKTQRCFQTQFSNEILTGSSKDFYGPDRPVCRQTESNCVPCGRTMAKYKRKATRRNKKRSKGGEHGRLLFSRTILVDTEMRPAVISRKK